MKIELTERQGRYEYEDLNEGEIFSTSGAAKIEDLYVMHLENGHLAAVSLHDGHELLMKGTAVVTVYDKKVERGN